MSLNQEIKKFLPEKVVSFITGALYIVTHIHHFLPNCFTLTPIKELFVILGGHERTPQGSEEFIKKFFKMIDNNTKNPILIDVGGNSGWFARLSIRFLGNKNFQLFGYEPLKSMSEILNDISSKYKNITYNFAAVGEHKGKAEIKELASSGLSSLKNINKLFHGYEDNYNTEVINKYEVDVVTLDCNPPEK